MNEKGEVGEGELEGCSLLRAFDKLQLCYSECVVLLVELGVGLWEDP